MKAQIEDKDAEYVSIGAKSYALVNGVTVEDVDPADMADAIRAGVVIPFNGEGWTPPPATFQTPEVDRTGQAETLDYPEARMKLTSPGPSSITVGQRTYEVDDDGVTVEPVFRSHFVLLEGMGQAARFQEPDGDVEPSDEPDEDDDEDDGPTPDGARAHDEAMRDAAEAYIAKARAGEEIDPIALAGAIHEVGGTIVDSSFALAYVTSDLKQEPQAETATPAEKPAPVASGAAGGAAAKDADKPADKPSGNKATPKAAGD